MFRNVLSIRAVILRKYFLYLPFKGMLFSTVIRLNNSFCLVESGLGA